MSVYEELIADYNMAFNHSGIDGDRVAKRLDELSKIGALENKGITRIGYSLEEKQSKELVINWMKEAGLDITIDGAGNVFGRLNGKTDGPSIMSGSHLDSVPNGGNFDGPLGVLAALEVVEAWKATGYLPPVPYEMAIFSDEEGSRFNAGLTGSKAFMGKFNNEEIGKLIDRKGNTIDDVLKTYNSNRKLYLTPSSREKDIALFIEVHIEQGVVLENLNRPVGIVSGIAGPAWLEVTFEGKAAHAGNTPMENRKDPVIAAGLFVAEIESMPRKVSETAVATVGKWDVTPNGANVIAEKVDLIVDIRDINEKTRDALLDLIMQKAKQIAAQRGLELTTKLNTKIKPQPIQQELQTELSEVMDELGITPTYIPSGAGHDAMILAEKIPVAMLFVRSKHGISHNPEEWTSLNDCVLSIHVLKTFVEKIMVRK